MLRTVKGLGLTLSMLVLISAPASAQDGVAGTWALTFDTSQGVLTAEIVLQQNGNEVTGTGDFDMAEAVQISDGLYEDEILSFLMHIGIEGQWLTVELEAEVDGDEMEGEAYAPDMGESASFTGKRSEG